MLQRSETLRVLTADLYGTWLTDRLSGTNQPLEVFKAPQALSSAVR
jgi:hypothetical protein